MELKGMNDRIKKLRKQGEETVSYILTEHATLMAGVYKKCEDEASIPELRVLSMKEIFSRKIIATENGELIVGDKGTEPQSTPTFPELCRRTPEGMKVMNGHELICFEVSDEDMKQQKETPSPIHISELMRP